MPASAEALSGDRARAGAQRAGRATAGDDGIEPAAGGGGDDRAAHRGGDSAADGGGDDRAAHRGAVDRAACGGGDRAACGGGDRAACGGGDRAADGGGGDRAADRGGHRAADRGGGSIARLALRLLVASVGALPFGALRAAGGLVGWVAGSLLRIRRAHVERAMRRAGVARPRAEAAAMYRALGANLLEWLWLIAHPDAPARDVAGIDAASLALLARARAGGRGVVIAASHTGNWEAAAAALAEHAPVTAIVKRMHVEAVDRFVRRARAARGIDAVVAPRAMARARAALRRGGALVVMIDQVPDRARHGVELELLGGAAWVDRTAAAIALRAGAPLVVAASGRDRSGGEATRILAVLEPPADARARRGWIDAATREATRALEAFVRAAPAQWMWLHRRWRRPAA